MDVGARDCLSGVNNYHLEAAMLSPQ